MIRSYAGLLALDLVYLGTGACVLFGLGLLKTRRPSLPLLGLAYTVGWALYGILASWALTAGSSLSPAICIGLCAAIATAGILLGSKIPALAESPTHDAASRKSWIGWSFGALLWAYLAVLCWRSVPGEADTNWDSWAFWLPKAKSIYYFDGLDNGPGGFTNFANRDYPPLGPTLEATNFHFMGTSAAAPLQFQHWLIVAAFFGAVASLLARRVSPAILWPSLAALAFMPRFGFYVGSSLPDETVGVLVALAAVCGALWLLERRASDLVLCVIFVSAATLLKNEGLVFGLAVMAPVCVVALRQRRWTLALLVIPAASLVPWKVWLISHGLPASSQYYNLSDLSPAHLIAASGRLGTSVVEMTGYLISPSRWLVAVPLALAGAALVFRRQPGLALLTDLLVALSMAGLIVVYWIGSIPIDFWLTTSGERTVMSIVMTCGALFPLLIAETLRDEAR